MVASGQPGALLSAWAGSPTDVWVVGGNPLDNSGPLVFHYDGTAWTKKATGQNVNLWWVTGWADTVFLSGEQGTILKYHPENDTFEKMTTPPPALTVFGMWGASSSDVWAVGGSQTGAGLVWHFDGTTWSDKTPAAVSGASCFKVNGIASDNVWISASNGTVMHWTGADPIDVQTIPDAEQQQAPLLSIGVNSKRATTVGGAFGGVLYENDGSGWNSASPASGNILRGVAVTETDAYAVGDSDTILHRSSGGTWSTEKAIQTGESFHADFIDSAGGVWVVGGEFESPMTKNGVLLHKGKAVQGGF